MPVLLQLCITARWRQTFYSQTVMGQCRHILTEILEQENTSWLHPAALHATLTFQHAPHPESSLQNEPIHILPQHIAGNLSSGTYLPMNKRSLWCSLTQGWSLALFQVHTPWRDMSTVFQGAGSLFLQGGPAPPITTSSGEGLRSWASPLCPQLLPTAWELHTTSLLWHPPEFPGLFKTFF